jgi:hypothetical protein
VLDDLYTTIGPADLTITRREAREIRAAQKAAEPFRDDASITAHNDGLARTHDDAQALIRYAVPGAHVTFWRPATGSDRTRAYQITMRRWGRADVAVQGAYTIPAPAERIARNAVEQADRVAAKG